LDCHCLDYGKISGKTHHVGFTNIDDQDLLLLVGLSLPCRFLYSCLTDQELGVLTKELASPVRLSGSRQAACSMMGWLGGSYTVLSTPSLLAVSYINVYAGLRLFISPWFTVRGSSLVALQD
jgi:hypothetical protein